MGQAECKTCSPGIYVSVDRQPGSTASDCRACPYGECKQVRCYLYCHPFSTQSINPHNQRHYIVRGSPEDPLTIFFYFGLFFVTNCFLFSSLLALFFCCHFDVSFCHPLKLYFQYLVFVSVSIFMV